MKRLQGVDIVFFLVSHLEYVPRLAELVEDLDVFVTILYNLLKSTRALLPLLRATIQFELAKTTPQNAALLLRGDSFLSKLCSLYSRNAGADYLRSILGEWLRSLLQIEGLDFEIQHSRLQVTNDLTLDAFEQNIELKRRRDANAIILIEATQRLFDNLLTSIQNSSLSSSAAPRSEKSGSWIGTLSSSSGGSTNSLCSVNSTISLPSTDSNPSLLIPLQPSSSFDSYAVSPSPSSSPAFPSFSPPSVSSSPSSSSFTPTSLGLLQDLRKVASYFRESARNQKYSSDIQLALVNSFFMLRFLSPAIVAPEAYQIIPIGTTITPRMRRNLILVAKVMQALSNNVEMGEKEDYMKITNDFIVRNSQAMQMFLDNFPREESKKIPSFFVPSRTLLQSELAKVPMKEFETLHQILHEAFVRLARDNPRKATPEDAQLVQLISEAAPPMLSSGERRPKKNGAKDPTDISTIVSTLHAGRVLIAKYGTEQSKRKFLKFLDDLITNLERRRKRSPEFSDEEVEMVRRLIHRTREEVESSLTDDGSSKLSALDFLREEELKIQGKESPHSARSPGSPQDMDGDKWWNPILKVRSGLSDFLATPVKHDTPPTQQVNLVKNPLYRDKSHKKLWTSRSDDSMPTASSSSSSVSSSGGTVGSLPTPSTGGEPEESEGELVDFMSFLRTQTSIPPPPSPPERKQRKHNLKKERSIYRSRSGKRASYHPSQDSSSSSSVSPSSAAGLATRSVSSSDGFGSSDNDVPEEVWRSASETRIVVHKGEVGGGVEVGRTVGGGRNPLLLTKSSPSTTFSDDSSCDEDEVVDLWSFLNFTNRLDTEREGEREDESGSSLSSTPTPSLTEILRGKHHQEQPSAAPTTTTTTTVSNLMVPRPTASSSTSSSPSSSPQTSPNSSPEKEDTKNTSLTSRFLDSFRSKKKKDKQHSTSSDAVLQHSNKLLKSSSSPPSSSPSASASVIASSSASSFPISVPPPMSLVRSASSSASSSSSSTPSASPSPTPSPTQSKSPQQQQPQEPSSSTSTSTELLSPVPISKPRKITSVLPSTHSQLLSSISLGMLTEDEIELANAINFDFLPEEDGISPRSTNYGSGSGTPVHPMVRRRPVSSNLSKPEWSDGDELGSVGSGSDTPISYTSSPNLSPCISTSDLPMSPSPSSSSSHHFASINQSAHSAALHQSLVDFLGSLKFRAPPAGNDDISGTSTENVQETIRDFISLMPKSVVTGSGSGGGGFGSGSGSGSGMGSGSSSSSSPSSSSPSSSNKLVSSKSTVSLPTVSRTLAHQLSAKNVLSGTGSGSGDRGERSGISIGKRSLGEGTSPSSGLRLVSRSSTELSSSSSSSSSSSPAPSASSSDSSAFSSATTNGESSPPTPPLASSSSSSSTTSSSSQSTVPSQIAITS